ncbi:hypothetical protein OOU_Y34scaffold00088g54 [Pyricularia oryzae Y34]|uniref:Uncharacterized protein n=2 Tax=Pyricularia oryzae TaxID=318829 RepID=A0AA97P9D4_PYRO3|nr:hypothetical protein OOU_Y34scaffold00088g54 [Pyricularia oryzae Y34]
MEVPRLGTVGLGRETPFIQSSEVGTGTGIRM